MRSDIDIAQHANLLPIQDIAANLGIPPDALDQYGRFKAKISLDYLASLADRPDGKLILVTAMTPTPAGEGKTTTTVGLGDALNRIGQRAIICLREPSLGPVFGLKGGAAGGGFAQVVPMEDINLHFTGDFNAVGLAHNLLAALLDNHVHHGNELNIDLRRVAWKRVMDMNDRALREIVCGLGGAANGFPREDGFDIVVASEVMAILCLATSLQDLKKRLANIVVAYTRSGDAVRASDLGAAGAMTVLLREALKPNLVQTLENNPAIIHGGPFANIAHGCNSVLATRAALKLGEYVVTEAGFGADLGAEKFIDIKCRKAGLAPAAAVIVATLRALKFQGGCTLAEVSRENLPALERGISNLERHVRNVRDRYGLPCLVSVNHFAHDTPAEFALLEARLAALSVQAISARHWSEGSAGASEVAHAVVALASRSGGGAGAGTVVGAGGGARNSPMRFVYPDDLPLWEKLRKVATEIYGAADVVADATVLAEVARLQAAGYGHYPVCIAKTQYSFSTDPELRGAPSGHSVAVREVRLAAGAEFIVFVCGDMLTMPGLPKTPAACRIDIDAEGRVVGLF
jgi:formate--tetrahydrofolate ligase